MKGMNLAETVNPINQLQKDIFDILVSSNEVDEPGAYYTE